MNAVRVKSGSVFSYTTVAAIIAGTIIIQGDLAAVATSDIPAGGTGSLDASGVFDVDKAAATVFTAGALVYWNDTTDLAVTTDNSGANKLLGKAVAAAGNGPTAVRVLLTP
jgi:predicted RecA/RadA family phage recombinase